MNPIIRDIARGLVLLLVLLLTASTVAQLTSPPLDCQAQPEVCR